MSAPTVPYVPDAASACSASTVVLGTTTYTSVRSLVRSEQLPAQHAPQRQPTPRMHKGTGTHTTTQTCAQPTQRHAHSTYTSTYVHTHSHTYTRITHAQLMHNSYTNIICTRTQTHTRTHAYTHVNNQHTDMRTAHILAYAHRVAQTAAACQRWLCPSPYPARSSRLRHAHIASEKHPRLARRITYTRRVPHHNATQRAPTHDRKAMRATTCRRVHAYSTRAHVVDNLQSPRCRARGAAS